MRIMMRGRRIFNEGKRIVTGGGPWKFNKMKGIASQMRGQINPMKYAGLARNSMSGGSLQINSGIDLKKVREPRFLKRNNIRLNF